MINRNFLRLFNGNDEGFRQEWCKFVEVLEGTMPVLKGCVADT